MESLRLAPELRSSAYLPCVRCSKTDRNWDRIAGKAYCPDCQESMVLGQGAPFKERTEKHLCAVCHRAGTVRYLTFPLQAEVPVEIDLCPEHLRALLGRRLGSFAFHQIRRRLHLLGLGVELIFLLHEAFYDDKGHALHPAVVSD
jgi:hypothetical protein